jgi:hypothetical protein
VTRRRWLALAVCAAGCSRSSAEKESLPEQVGSWRRASVEDLARESAPPLVQQYGLRRMRRARYEGDKTITVIAYEMNSAGTPFELRQKWRVEPRTLPYHKGSFFYLVETDDENPAARIELARALENALK